jgi:hypothetical protein
VRHHPQGAINLHRHVIYDPKLDLILAGIEGSLRYNRGRYQYTQRQMWQMVFGLVPQLLFNKVRYGRYLDVLSPMPPRPESTMKMIRLTRGWMPSAG